MKKRLKKCALFLGVLALNVVVAIVLVGCSGNAPTNASGDEVTSAQAGNDAIVRSESTVVNDSKTNSIITSQDSFQIGTYIKISIYSDKEVPSAHFDRIFEEIDQFEKWISKNITTSEISMINENAGKAPVKVSKPIFELIQMGIQYGEISDGGFDISVGPLVDLWGIGSEDAHVPEESEIKDVLSKIDYHNIILSEADQNVFLKVEGMSLDLGAIAKGYIADQVKALIQEEGYESAIINLGGNVLTVGHKPNSEAWSIGVRDPKGESKDIVGILKLQDNSIVSSGTYERFFMEDGVKYHHILNPKTGYPEENQLQSVSIISEKSVVGDALSTTVFVMGLEAGYAYVNSLDQVEALFIMEDGSIYSTPGLVDVFSLTHKGYELKEFVSSTK
ncbi:FAD:protein FMN transferase [Fusibacter sp. 3D3]|uniref:FAD:protein FMN transferase n=1 Tax=Fusibacter sp. 3D3 TaxID=1048380 RepID=UPI0008568147|nr:FAD:protein FMN transferase [Fusibacter sp. 3D3]GAU76173.1 hypothetical similar to thiamin biosynthesis lipoprotein ApbE [Fusibacter sp. 3D3]